MQVVVFSFFAQCLQPFEIQTHKNLSAKKIKKTYIKICIYQKSGISLSSSSGEKPERLVLFIHLLNFFIMYTFLVSFWNSPRVEVQTQSDDIEEVLEIAIPKFEKTAPGFLWDVEEVESAPDFDENNPKAIYIDATMEGASRPYYISEDVIIEQI